jgi:hypothetical protein
VQRKRFAARDKAKGQETRGERRPKAPPGVQESARRAPAMRGRAAGAQGATVAQTTQVCTPQLPAFPALDSRPDAIQPVPASVGRLVVRNVLVVDPVRTPPPPTARLPAGQFCCSLFGLVLLDAPLPEISCSPLAPGGPCGPGGPAGPVGPLGPRGI